MPGYQPQKISHESVNLTLDINKTSTSHSYLFPIPGIAALEGEYLTW